MPELLGFAQCFLRHPILIAEVLLVVLALFGAGRAVGLPLLFWHEWRGAQILAGMSATLLMGEVLFVAYLADRSDHGPPLPFSSSGLPQFLQIGAAGWAAIVLTATLYRLFLRTRQGSRSPAVVTPRFRTVSDDELAGLAAADPPTWPFAAGCVGGAGVVLALALLGGALSSALGPFAARMLSANVPDPSLHFVAALLFLLMLLAFCLSSSLFSTVSTPAIEICLLLGLIAAAYGGVAYWLHSSGVALAIPAALLAAAGLRPRRLRIDALEERYRHPVPYPPALRPGGAPLLRFNAGWPEGKPRPLILICVSGGGIRAATWTAAILDGLEHHPRFGAAVRLVTGASGGMVGAALWVARLYRGGTPADLVAAVAGDALTAVARRLVFRDIPFAFLPLVNGDNRGQALERAWDAQTGGVLRVPLAALREAERDGRVPSLVFSPMIVEDGRRLIVSNLDLSAITTNQVRWLGQTTPDTASLSAFHIEDVLPGALDQIPLSTAARLSASFPYVSPAAALPTRPSRRVVDAGYYDNYGLSLACEWLRECLTKEKAWFTRNVARVLLLQIRDNVSELSVDGEASAEGHPQDRHRFGRLSSAVARGFEWLTSPITGLLSARESVMLFRNDAALEAATQLCDSELGPGFLTTTIFDFKGEASLSWYLTRAELAGIRDQAGSRGIGAKVARVFDWLESARPPGASAPFHDDAASG